jgi:phage terminase large subunit-like protein
MRRGHRTGVPKRASFLAELETELLLFPEGCADDQVDSISEAPSYKRSGL